jgi:hypothetical protein
MRSLPGRWQASNWQMAKAWHDFIWSVVALEHVRRNATIMVLGRLI